MFIGSNFRTWNPEPGTIFIGYPNWMVAEREGFEPSVPLLTAHTISSRAPSASSDISPALLNDQTEKVNVNGNELQNGIFSLSTNDGIFRPPA